MFVCYFHIMSNIFIDLISLIDNFTRIRIFILFIKSSGLNIPLICLQYELPYLISYSVVIDFQIFLKRYFLKPLYAIEVVFHHLAIRND